MATIKQFIPTFFQELLEHGQVDLAKLRAGGIDAGFFAVDVTRAWKNHLAYAVDAFGFFLADLTACEGAIVLVRSAAELLKAKAEGRIALRFHEERREAHSDSFARRETCDRCSHLSARPRPD